MLGASLLAALYHFDDIKALIGPEGTAERLSLAARTAAGKPKEPGFAGEVHLRADRRGHFIFEGNVDGRSVTFMADTGASIVALTYEDARRANFCPA